MRTGRWGVMVAAVLLSGSAFAWTLFDVTGNGKVNAADVQAIINAILELGPSDNTDVNQDDRTNVKDVQMTVSAILYPDRVGKPDDSSTTQLLTFTVDDDASTTKSRSVSLEFMHTGIPTEYRVSETADFLDAAWNTYSQSSPLFFLSPRNGTKTVYLQIRNEAGESYVAHDDITLSESAPELRSAWSSPRPFPYTQTVDAYIYVTGTPLEYMVAESLDFAGSVWQAYENPNLYWHDKDDVILEMVLSCTTSPGNGYRPLYVKLRNETGESDPIDVSFTRNELFLTSFEINSGADVARERDVTLDFITEGSPSYYMAAETADFLGAAWQSYQSTPAFTLSSGDGDKTVYLKIRDYSGKEVTASDSIFLHESFAPELSNFRINKGAIETLEREVTLSVNFTRSPSSYMVSESPDFAGAEWMSYSEPLTFSLSEGNGEKTIYFKMLGGDDESETSSDAIFLNQQPSKYVLDLVWPEQPLPFNGCAESMALGPDANLYFANRGGAAVVRFSTDGQEIGASQTTVAQLEPVAGKGWAKVLRITGSGRCYLLYTSYNETYPGNQGRLFSCSLSLDDLMELGAWVQSETPDTPPSASGALASSWSSAPIAIAPDSAGNLYGLFHDKISKVSIDSGVELNSFPVQFTSPKSIAVNSKGEVYVTDNTTHQVTRFALDGTILNVFGGQGQAPGQFRYLQDVAVGPSDNVYISDNSAWIHIFSAGGTHLSTVKPGMSFYSFVSDADGKLYVGYDKLVKKYGADGSLLWAVGEASRSLSIFYPPGQIALDHEGALLIADPYNLRIRKFTTVGTEIQTWSAFPLSAPVGQQGVRLTALAVNTAGKILVGAAYPNGIRQFSPDGVLERTFATDCWGIAALPDGDCLSISLAMQDEVQRYSGTGALLDTWTLLSDPTRSHGVATDAQGNIFLAHDGYPPKVAKYTSQHARLWVNRLGASSSPGFLGPIAVDSQGNVYVARTREGIISKYTTNGSFVTEWGGVGTDPDLFNGIGGLAVDDQGNVYVADSGNRRIKRFRPE